MTARSKSGGNRVDLANSGQACDRSSDRLPWGAAAVMSLLAGFLAGGVPGMAQTWYVGPIARKFGPFGGDVGIYLSFVITLIVYPILRHFEIKKTGR